MEGGQAIHSPIHEGHDTVNAEKLISMAAARGINLVEVAQQSTDVRPRKETVSHIHAGHRFVKLLETSQRRAYGKSTRTMVAEQDWSAADVGHALAGLDNAQTLAAMFAWAGASQNYWPLVVELRKVAVRLARQRHWPDLVENHRGEPMSYLERLCEMALFDDQHPGALDYAPPARVGQDDQSQILRAIYCEVTLPTWKHVLADRYSFIWGVWVGWLDEAARRAQAKLREDEDEEGA
jgi:hypothetical protein